MEKELITQAAESAIHDVQFACTVKAVYQPPGKQTWCVQFTKKYGELCDEFRDRAGKENSPEVIREKIKRHLFRMKPPARIRIRKSTGEKPKAEGSFPSTAIEGIEKVFPSAAVEGIENLVSQAPALAGKVIAHLSDLASSVFHRELAGEVSVEAERLPRTPLTGKKKAGSANGKPAKKGSARSSKKRKTTKKAVSRTTAKKSRKKGSPKRKPAKRAGKKGLGKRGTAK